jgi:hypothetical protein
MVTPVPVGAIVPLSLPMELDPQALKTGTDRTPSSSHRGLSSISPHLKASVFQSERLGAATPFDGLGRYAGKG